MKKLIYLFIALALIFSSCRATKQTVRNETTVSENIQFDISAEKTKNTQEEILKSAVSEHNIEVDIDETIINIQWSSPDSLGNQYMISTTQIVRTTRTQEQSTAIVEIEETRQTEIVETLIDNSIFETDYKSVTKKETKRLPTWQLTLGLFMLVVLKFAIVIFIIRIRK